MINPQTVRTLSLPLIIGALLMATTPSPASSEEQSRSAAVAGTFYSDNPALLRTTLLQLLADNKPLCKPVHLLISPHAGYLFSGTVAAKGFATIDRTSKRVIIIGPSHVSTFCGIALPAVDYYQTPLGKVSVDRPIVNQLRKKTGVISSEGFDEMEHCIEVQLPFLQLQLSSFSLIPVLTGTVDPKKVAALLMPFIDTTTLVIASSDFSHFKPQETAQIIDRASRQTILSGNDDGPINACGETAIRTIMTLAKQKNLQPQKLDARTSYDTAPEHCAKNRVVGYASIVYLPAASHAEDFKRKEHENNVAELAPEQKQLLLNLARQSLLAAVTGTTVPVPPSTDSMLETTCGCFVTLTKNGNLRGCIGYIEAIKPLINAIIDNARNAALHDPRFPAVTPEEIEQIIIELSVLSKPEQLHYKNSDELLTKIIPGEQGVILKKGPLQSTYLPQVWEQLPEKIPFLESLSRKGGMQHDGWKTADVRVYQVLHFSE